MLSSLKGKVWAAALAVGGLLLAGSAVRADDAKAKSGDHRPAAKSREHGQKQAAAKAHKTEQGRTQAAAVEHKAKEKKAAPATRKGPGAHRAEPAAHKARAPKQAKVAKLAKAGGRKAPGCKCGCPHCAKRAGAAGHHAAHAAKGKKVACACHGKSHGHHGKGHWAHGRGHDAHASAYHNASMHRQHGRDGHHCKVCARSGHGGRAHCAGRHHGGRHGHHSKGHRHHGHRHHKELRS